MLQFLKHKKFWVPCVTLLALLILTEVVLRLGWYNRWVKPESHLGNALTRLHALEAYGLNKIDWITVGSSRIDWGIDHGALAKIQKKNGLDHVRLSFGSANFMTMQATIDWSLEHMNSLQGVMLGANENTFSHFNIINNQFKVAWPFKNHMDLDKYKPLSKNQYTFLPYHRMAWVNYFDDIKAMLRNPASRMEELNQKDSFKKILSFRKRNHRNLCAHPLKTIQDCVASTKAVNFKKGKNRGFRVINETCSHPKTKQRAKTNHPILPKDNYQQLITNWVKLINHITEQDIQFTLVLLPEHESLKYIYKPNNASDITEQILAQVSHSPLFTLIDLRDLLDGMENCEYFSDPHHLNNNGISLVNEAVLKHFKNQKK